MSASNAAAKKRRAIISPTSNDFSPNKGGTSYNSQRTPPPATQVQQSNGVNMNKSVYMYEQNVINKFQTK